MDGHFDGLEVGEYDGVTVVKCSIWDRFIQAYQNDKTKLNLPHRAVLCSPDNLMYGCEGDNPISDLDIWFERKPRKNYIYSTGKTRFYDWRGQLGASSILTKGGILWEYVMIF